MQVSQSSKLANVCYEIRGQVMREAKRLEAEGHNVLKLNIGNPAPFCFSAPEDMLQDVILNLPNAHGYGDSKGLLSARSAVVQYYQGKGVSGVDIEVRPANYKTIRGETLAGCLADEVAFWHLENSANPDTLILDAVRPGLATTGGPLCVLSSPYARKGELYRTHQRDFGPNGDPAVLVLRAPSQTMNPSLDPAVVKRASKPFWMAR